MTLYISVNRAIIVSNKKHNRNDGPFEIRKSRQDTHPISASAIPYDNPKRVRMVYDPVNPLVSGAVAWIEVDTD